MKKITGYVKCPICEGEGQHTTKASDFERGKIMNANSIAFNGWLESRSSLSDAGLPYRIDVPEPEYQECTKCKGEQVLPLWECDE